MTYYKSFWAYFKSLEIIKNPTPLWCAHEMEYYTARKGNELLIHAITRTNPKITMWNERCQKKEYMLYDFIDMKS